MKRSVLILIALVLVFAAWFASRGSTKLTPPETPTRTPVDSTPTRALLPREPGEGNDQAGRALAAEPADLETRLEEEDVAPAGESARVGDPTGADPSSEAAWALEYQALSAAELQQAAAQFERKVQELESDSATERHDRGIYDVIASGKIGPGEAGANEIVVYQMGNQGELHRVVLTKDEYPDLFAMKHKSLWLKAHALLAAAGAHK